MKDIGRMEWGMDQADIQQAQSSWGCTLTDDMLFIVILYLQFALISNS